MKLSRRQSQRLRRRTRPASLPGTIVSPPTAQTSKLRLVQFDDLGNHSDVEVKDVSKLPLLRNNAGVTWVIVEGLGDAQVIESVGRHFNLHPLALEDVVNVHQRPKVEMYHDLLFMVVRAHEAKNLGESQQISMFLGHNFVVTFQETPASCVHAVRKRLATGKGRIRDRQADYLLYALVDGVIDGYFPVLEVYGEKLDSLEDLISARPEHNMIHQIHDVRTELLMIRRSVWPLREAINSLIRDSGTLISDETDLYLRDCYDHTVQIIDVIETDRELCADLRDFYLTVVSNRMNQVMKLLTLIATLFMPLTFVAGLYGMNFNTDVSPWNMPELNWWFGYPFALAVMATTALAMFMFFRKRGWLSP